MNYLNIHTDTLKSEAFISSDPTERATWLCLLGWCVTQENGGKIIACREWSDRKWQQICGVTKAEVEAVNELLSWSGENLRIAFYPTTQEEEVKQKREIARENGKRGGRPKKKETNVGTNVGFEKEPTLESKTSFLETQTEPTSESVKEGKGRERKEKKGEVSPVGSCPLPDALIPIWAASPKSCRERSSKKQVTDEWKRIKAADRPSADDLNEALAAWMDSEKWKDGFGEGLHLWIKRRQWENLPTPEPKTNPAHTGTRELKFGGRTGNVIAMSDVEKMTDEERSRMFD